MHLSSSGLVLLTEVDRRRLELELIVLDSCSPLLMTCDKYGRFEIVPSPAHSAPEPASAPSPYTFETTSTIASPRYRRATSLSCIRFTLESLWTIESGKLDHPASGIADSALFERYSD